MGDTLEVMGVRFDVSSLSKEAREYIDHKLRRILRRRRRGEGVLNRLYNAVLPSDWRRVDVESRVRGCRRVCVVGCAAGIETMAIKESCDVVVGFDVDRRSLRVAAELRAGASAAHRGAHFLAASGAVMPFRDGSFDAVLSDNVVEHIPAGALERHLAEARRVLKPGGFYVFTTPNAAYELVPDAEHISLHTYEGWERLCRDAGFAKVATPRRRSGPLGPLDWKKERERTPRALGSGNTGLKMVTLVAYR